MSLSGSPNTAGSNEQVAERQPVTCKGGPMLCVGLVIVAVVPGILGQTCPFWDRFELFLYVFC